ncbi:MAG: ComF family protein [Anaerolineales bacterium]|nr:ComF family protein [Anaerolineales bacterium]
MMAMLRDLEWAIDLVTAVPIGAARRAERGYNQAALLALSLALGSVITYQPRALTKARETLSQVGLTFIERRDNVSGAFQARTRIVRGKCVLVVDDVTTSGATIEACSTALLEAGAREVYGLTLARAV